MGGGSDSSSKEITIDDVVKFIHDDISKADPNFFPYTTWDSIPNYNDVNEGQICKSTSITTSIFSLVILLTPSYTIGKKGDGGIDQTNELINKQL